MSSNTLELSPLYLKWREEARELGLEEGREIGHEAGVDDGLRNAATLLLRGRFGSVPPEMEQAIASASRGHLDNFMLHATTETLDELRARLSA